MPLTEIRNSREGVDFRAEGKKQVRVKWAQFQTFLSLKLLKDSQVEMMRMYLWIQMYKLKHWGFMVKDT